MRRIRANGLDIGYDIAGAGPPLIALHGATMSGRDEFADLLPSFSSAFTVHLPDARGHGATAWDVASGGFEAETLVDDLEAFADGLGLTTFHLVGFSMGGMTALGFAIRSPGRVRTLVVAGISTAREPRASVVRHLLDPARIESEDPDWARRLGERHDAVQGSGAWRRLLPAIAADVASQALYSPAELRRIDAPTLVASGDRDPFAPVVQVAELARQVRHGRLLIVPGHGHDIVSGPVPELDAALAAFYRSTEPIARRRANVHPEVAR
jgi:pimeloyl-ACP methyl ester carboxylesterase